VKGSRSVAALALLAGAVAPVAGPVAAACAGEGGRAALVVDTGAAVTTYCVALPDDSVTGIELVELAGDQHGLDYSLGFGGEAVCRLEGVGPEGDDCFGEYPEFWGYWHGNGSGGWTWAGTGAGSASIEDGDVDGWSWGAGDNGSNHQAPPATEHDDVCIPIAEPGKEREPARGTRPGGPSSAPQPAAATPSPSPSDAPEAVKPSRRKPRRNDTPVEKRRVSQATAEPPIALPSPEPSTVAAEPAAGEGDGGPPVTGLVGLLAAAGLAGAVWTTSRRRPRPARSNANG
jgi:hypothetical protein